MANWLGVVSKKSVGETVEDEELEEEEVWGVLKEKEDPISSARVVRKGKEKLSATRVIPRATSGGNLTAPLPSQHRQLSAPVSIPDWTKIYKLDPKKAYVDDDYDGSDDEMIPPHEFIARRIARSRIASYSMCEGVGRTLKGRDLSRLRNAIFLKTGFLEY